MTDTVMCGGRRRKSTAYGCVQRTGAESELHPLENCFSDVRRSKSGHGSGSNEFTARSQSTAAIAWRLPRDETIELLGACVASAASKYVDDMCCIIESCRTVELSRVYCLNSLDRREKLSAKSFAMFIFQNFCLQLPLAPGAKADSS